MFLNILILLYNPGGQNIVNWDGRKKEWTNSKPAEATSKKNGPSNKLERAETPLIGKPKQELSRRNDQEDSPQEWLLTYLLWFRETKEFDYFMIEKGTRQVAFGERKRDNLIFFLCSLKKHDDSRLADLLMRGSSSPLLESITCLKFFSGEYFSRPIAGSF